VLNGHRDSLGRSARGFDPNKPAGGAGGDLLREEADTTGAAWGRNRTRTFTLWMPGGTRRDPLAVAAQAA